MKKSMISVLSFFAATQLFAAQQTAHTWHTVTATDGQWNATLQVISEADHAWFVGPDGQTKISGFKLDSSAPQKYGFDFDNETDYNVAYSLTLTEQTSNSNFSAKACIFVVTAKGAAQPDITALPYNGANCQWKINVGVGEDFTVG